MPFGTFDTVGAGTTPQSIELKIHSGVAEGTLVFGSVKWTDWSVIDTLDYTIAPGLLNVFNQNEYFWKDGWTVSAGVARQFNDWLSGSLSLTWDQGVSTSEDLLTDTWTLGTGIQMANERGALQFGGALSYLERYYYEPDSWQDYLNRLGTDALLDASRRGRSIYND